MKNTVFTLKNWVLHWKNQFCNEKYSFTLKKPVLQWKIQFYNEKHSFSWKNQFSRRWPGQSYSVSEEKIKRFLGNFQERAIKPIEKTMRPVDAYKQQWTHQPPDSYTTWVFPFAGVCVSPLFLGFLFVDVQLPLFIVFPEKNKQQ